MSRSLKKGPYVASYLFDQVETMNNEGKKILLKLGHGQQPSYQI